MIDEVVPRSDLKDRIGLLLDYLAPVAKGGVA